MRFWASAIGILVVIAACSSPTKVSTPTLPPEETVTPIPRQEAPATSTPTPAPTVTLAPVSTGTATPVEAVEEMETLRQLASDYWAAFNSYDADKVLSYLEDSYGSERESNIREDIGRLEQFRIKLGISEQDPPQLTGPGQGEMFLLMKEPLGERRIRMAFALVGGEWKITYAEGVK